MTEVASRELRNDTAGLIRRAAAGERDDLKFMEDDTTDYLAPLR
jgi:hypothetical protein